jgi:hypothetical protein
MEKQISTRLSTSVFFIIFSSFLFLLFAQESHFGYDETETKQSEVTYSKNIELFGIAGNLTPLWEETKPNFPFAVQAREQFMPFKDHRGVKYAQKLIKKRGRRYLGLYAFYLSDLPEAKFDYPSLPFFAKLLIKRSIPQIRDFYYASDFEQFWRENAAYYDKLKLSIEEKIKNVDIPTLFGDYFGQKMDHHVLIFTPQMARFKMGQLVKSRGETKVYVVFGPREKEKNGDYFIQAQDLLINIVFFEFSRLYTSDVLEKQEKLLKQYDHIHKKFKNKVTRKELRSWSRFFYDNLFRAVQSRLVLQSYDKQTSLAVLERSSRGDFMLVPLLYELLSEYEKNRKVYKNFASFMPDLLANVKERLKSQ